MVLSAVIMAGGIYLLAPGGIEVGFLPLSVPHPYGDCQEARNSSVWLQHRLRQLLEGPPADIKERLLTERLAYEYPYDFCLPKYEIRHTIAYWLTDRQVFTQPPPLPPKRPPLLTARAAQPKPRQMDVTIPAKVTGAVPLPPTRPRGT